MIYLFSESPIWPADWKPAPTTPKAVRGFLNALIRHDFKGHGRAYTHELIRTIHSLAIIVPDVSIVSTCKRFVAIPCALPSGMMAVDIKPVVDDKNEQYLGRDAWADAVKKWRDSGRPSIDDLQEREAGDLCSI